MNRAEIHYLNCQDDCCERFACVARRDYEQKILRLEAALGKISDPRKRDHQESDAYTQLGCVMNIAKEALE